MRKGARFKGVYWRQLFLTAGMVLLTLGLLGASFFALSYNYAKQERSNELEEKARIVSQLSAEYLETGGISDPGSFRRLLSYAASVSRVDFLVCDTSGQILVSTDVTRAVEGKALPDSITQQVLDKGFYSRKGDLGGLYTAARFLVGVPVTSQSGTCVGMVFAVAATTALDNLWQGFIGLFLMTAFVALMVAFMASSVTTMRQIQPIREMVQATRRYADGDFDIRMNDYGRDDEIGELAASFNNMAESLQQT